MLKHFSNPLYNLFSKSRQINVRSSWSKHYFSFINKTFCYGVANHEISGAMGGEEKICKKFFFEMSFTGFLRYNEKSLRNNWGGKNYY